MRWMAASSWRMPGWLAAAGGFAVPDWLARGVGRGLPNPCAASAVRLACAFDRTRTSEGGTPPTVSGAADLRRPLPIE
jgi:hypothetical protein